MFGSAVSDLAQHQFRSAVAVQVRTSGLWPVEDRTGFSICVVAHDTDTTGVTGMEHGGGRVPDAPARPAADVDTGMVRCTSADGLEAGQFVGMEGEPVQAKARPWTISMTTSVKPPSATSALGMPSSERPKNGAA